MTHPEPTSINAIVSENAAAFGLCGAGMSSGALRNQVDRATEHLGHVLTPEQLTFIEDMVALFVDGDLLLAQFASRMRSASVAPSQEVAGNFCEVWPILSEVAGSFCRVSDACTMQQGAYENPLPRANRRRADVERFVGAA
jgi:hypothetical protein